MDIRILYITAVAIAAVSGGYYYFSGKEKKLDVDAVQSMTYTAEKINLVQTNEIGQLSARATVDRLEQDLNNKTANLKNLNASTYKNGEVDAIFYAAKANSYENNQRVVLSEQVLSTRLIPQGEMQFDTSKLTIYPQERRLETDQTVEVTSPQASFISQGMKANLNEGQYEFFNIRGKYEP